MSNVFFIGDTHFGHKAIVTKYKTRPGFETIEEHDEFLVKAWNETVKKKDIVYHLGDIAFGDNIEILDRLNGRKRLILGNHDELHISEYIKYFEEVHGVIKKYGMWISHMPIHPQEFFGKKANLHGHIHDPSKSIKDPRYICLSVENLEGYKPITLDAIKERVAAIEEVTANKVVQSPNELSFKKKQF